MDSASSSRRNPVDGSTAVIALPSREVAAHLRRVYDGAVLPHDLPASDAMWGRDSLASVWVWLEPA